MNATSSKVQSNASVARMNQAVQVLEQLQYSMQEPGKPSKGRGVQTVVRRSQASKVEEQVQYSMQEPGSYVRVVQTVLRRNQVSGNAAIIPSCVGPTSPYARKMQEVE